LQKDHNNNNKKTLNLQSNRRLTRENRLSDTITLKVSKRKIYFAILLIVILAVVGVGGFLAYRYFTTPSLHIDSFTVKNEPNLGWYANASAWAQTWLLNWTFSNTGGGAANSVTLVYAFYNSRGCVENSTENYGTVVSNMQITGSVAIIVVSSMQITYPATFRIFLYQGNTLVDQATLAY
jgi:hypothetical protein